MAGQQRWKSIFSLVLVVYLLIVCDENRGSTAISLPSPHADELGNVKTPQPDRLAAHYYTLKNANVPKIVRPSSSGKDYESMKDSSGKIIKGAFPVAEASFQNTINANRDAYINKRIVREVTFKSIWYSYHDNIDVHFKSDSYSEKHIYDSDSIKSAPDLNNQNNIKHMLDRKNLDMCHSPGQKLTQRQFNTFACVTKAELQDVKKIFIKEIAEINKKIKSTLCVQKIHTQGYSETEEYCHKSNSWNLAPGTKHVTSDTFRYKVRTRATPHLEFSFTLLTTDRIVRLTMKNIIKNQKITTHVEFDVTKVDGEGVMDVSLVQEKGVALTGNRDVVVFDGHFRSQYGPNNNDMGLRSKSGRAATFSSLSNVKPITVEVC